MEELRSTEILAREIEAEAYKKADKILERAGRETQKILSQTQERIKKDVEEKARFYEGRLEQLKKNAQSFVPLEKERFLISFYHEKLSGAMNDYFKGSGKENIYILLGEKLERCADVLKGKKLKVSFFSGLTESLVKKIFAFQKKIDFNDVKELKEISFEESGEESERSSLIHEGMIIETQDQTVRLRLTMDEIIREIKDKHSNELALALFGGRLPQ